MENVEFVRHATNIESVVFNESTLSIVDSTGVLLKLKFETDGNYFDDLIDFIYKNYFEESEFDNNYKLLHFITLKIVLEYYKVRIPDDKFIDIEDVFTGETNFFAVESKEGLVDEISNLESINLQCHKMGIGFREVDISKNKTLKLERIYLIKV